uniref:Uncharacterized protein n=1 Tax=Tubifex tubifex TaxID=6386 RepID=A0A146J7U5_TUBTU|nr:hypothetical protein [Tubifex tubifex]BAU79594.1 hypothetical protein [Tubifex tubifex]
MDPLSWSLPKPEQQQQQQASTSPAPTAETTRTIDTAAVGGHWNELDGQRSKTTTKTTDFPSEAECVFVTIRDSADRWSDDVIRKLVSLLNAKLTTDDEWEKRELNERVSELTRKLDAVQDQARRLEKESVDKSEDITSKSNECTSIKEELDKQMKRASELSEELKSAYEYSCLVETSADREIEKNRRLRRRYKYYTRRENDEHERIRRLEILCADKTAEIERLQTNRDNLPRCFDVHIMRILVFILFCLLALVAIVDIIYNRSEFSSLRFPSPTQ